MGAASRSFRRRNRAGHGARRDRRLRVQQPDLGPPLRRAGRRQELHAGQPPSGDRSTSRSCSTRTKFDALAKEQQAILQVRRRGGLGRASWKAMDIYSKDLEALKTKQGSRSSARRSRLRCAAQGLGQVVAEVSADRPGSVLEEGDGLPEGLGQAGCLLRDEQRSRLSRRLRALLRPRLKV